MYSDTFTTNRSNIGNKRKREAGLKLEDAGILMNAADLSVSPPSTLGKETVTIHFKRTGVDIPSIKIPSSRHAISATPPIVQASPPVNYQYWRPPF
jgi:hypothetical protein